MKLDQIDHVAIITSDYRKTLEFYVEKLGFSLLRDSFRPERGDWKLDLRQGGVQLEIFVMPNAPARPSQPEARGLRHLAFWVPDVERAAGELEALGIPCQPIRMDTDTNRRITFFHDPDGLPLELHE